MHHLPGSVYPFASSPRERIDHWRTAVSTTSVTNPDLRSHTSTQEQAQPMNPSAAPTGNLEITVSRAELLRELTAAQSVVERKTTIPILSNFLFEAVDDKLTITATDLDQSLKTSCAAKVKKPGACTIPTDNR